jgi:hypothetical protein
VFRRQPRSVGVPEGLMARRTVRYIHLNPCRGELVSRPLAWPWSTHRDRLGLAVRPAVSRAAEVLRVPFRALERRGPARTLLVRSLRVLGVMGTTELAALTGLAPRTVRDVGTRRDPRWCSWSGCLTTPASRVCPTTS